MTIQKSGETRNDIGLSVSESKLLLNTVQQSVVQLQADKYTQHHIRCPHCLAARRIKGKQKIPVPDAVWRYSGIRASGVPVPL